MKFLVAGLGNVGVDYSGTRHNIGFEILDALADQEGIRFTDRRFAFTAEFRYRGRIYFLIKPSTYVNLSGRAVHYWLKKEKISDERFLVVLDDIALPFGSLRMRPHGGDGGHNGLSHIIHILSTRQFTRLRFGIGSDFLPGDQVNHVLGEWTPEEEDALPGRIRLACDAIRSFGTIGTERTMNEYNNR